jgi:TPR repeat protein/curved DNA-binding protein CbpA
MMNNKDSAKNYYELLGVERNAEGVVISAAYKALAKLNHPDIAGKLYSSDYMGRLNDAYATLSDPSKRKKYDGLVFKKEKFKTLKKEKIRKISIGILSFSLLANTWFVIVNYINPTTSQYDGTSSSLSELDKMLRLLQEDLKEAHADKSRVEAEMALLKEKAKSLKEAETEQVLASNKENTINNKKEISSLVRQLLKLVDQAEEPTPLDKSLDELDPVTQSIKPSIDQATEVREIASPKFLLPPLESIATQSIKPSIDQATEVRDIASPKSLLPPLESIDSFASTPSSEQENARGAYSLGLKYLKLKDYKEAVKWLTKSAEQGYAYAQNRLGNMYTQGEGVLQDYKQAIKWYTRAAEQGYAYAQNNLGFRYLKGEGVPQNYKEAVKWYARAAEQGNAIAQNSLGWRYFKGEGVLQDYKEAVKWLTKAAEQGNANAQTKLGVTYANGEGVPQNYKEAVKWLTKAAEQEDALAHIWLGKMYKNGNGLPQKYKKAQDSFKESIRILTEALLIRPNNGSLWYNMACNHSLLGDQVEAKECLKRAISIDEKFKKVAVDDSDLDKLREWVSAEFGF